MKVVKTIAMIQGLPTFPNELQKGLEYSGVSWWTVDHDLYVLNATLTDLEVFCKQAQKQEFVYGKINGTIGKYQTTKSGKAVWVDDVPESMVPKDYLLYAKQISNPEELDHALDDQRTFLSRSLHRRNATR